MAAHHFFAEPAAFGQGTVTLDGDEAHHASRVLRVRVGERISVADGSGRVVEAVVADAGDRVGAEIVSESFHDRPVPAIALFQALTKSDKLDDVIEKATEVGVHRIVPFVSERSVVRWDERKRARATQRWKAIAKASAKQSRSPFIPVIGDVGTDAYAILEEPGPKIVLHEGAQDRLRDALHGQPPDDLAVLVGPEGGLSEGEIEHLAQTGAQVVSLGPRVMRTQTAGPVAAAIVGFVYGAVG